MLLPISTMTGSSNSTNTIASTSTHSQRFRRVYICLITFELASIAIKYEGLSTNPFQEIHASVLLFIIAIFCHAIALAAKISVPPAAILFHVSGAVACESLMWILVAEFWWRIIINVLMLMFGALCFYYNQIYETISKLNLCTCFGRMLIMKPCEPVGQEGDPHANQKDLEAHEVMAADAT